MDLRPFIAHPLAQPEQAYHVSLQTNRLMEAVNGFFIVQIPNGYLPTYQHCHNTALSLGERNQYDRMEILMEGKIL